MSRVLRAALNLGTIFLVLFCTAPPKAAADNASLCVVADPGCLAPGGIQVRLVLGPSDALIVGGQAIVRYDPKSLRLIEAVPGRACDPTSPFAFKLFDEDDPAIGEERCAFGINFLEGLPPAGMSTTLACLSFAHVGNLGLTTPLCLMEGVHPFETVLVDLGGHLIPIDNSQDCPSNVAPPALACDEVAPGANCNCVPNTSDCRGLDTSCRIGVCNPVTTHCEVVSINEGGPCDDEDACSLVDRCRAGACVGEGCRNQSLCTSSESCLGLDSQFIVKIRFTEGDRVIQGAQFSVEFDPTELVLLDVSPGDTCDDSPFAFEVAEMVDELAGKIFYAVGLQPGGPPGIRETVTLACLTYVDLGDPGGEVCLFSDSGPFSTLLVDDSGRAVPPGRPELCPLERERRDGRCTGFSSCIIPTVSEWGLVAMTLLLMVAAKIRFGYSRGAPMRTSTGRMAD